MKILITLLLTSTLLYSNSKVSLKTIYNKISFIDKTSSSLRYDSDIYGIRLGSELGSSDFNNNIDLDLAFGISGRKGQDFFYERPFYINGRFIYLGNYNFFKKYNSLLIGVGGGIEYNIEGSIPGDLYGPGVSWIQTLSLISSFTTEYVIDSSKSFKILFYLPLAGFINRPAWTGAISREIELLSRDSYFPVLFNRGEFFSFIDYQSLSLSLIYKKDLGSGLELYLEGLLNYSYTDYPREFQKISSKFIFGFNFKTINF